MFGNIDRLQSHKLYYDSPLTESITRDFDALIHIQKAANYCERHSSDENAWCQNVVVPLLESALHKPRFSIGKVISVQTHTINPLFSDSADSLAQKKIDYAIFIDDDSDEAHALYEALKKRVPKESQGLWTHISTANLIPLFIFEVKPDGQDKAQFQLMTGARAFLKYLQSLLNSSASKSKMKSGRKTSFLKRLPPVIGWIVHRHEWKAYVSYSIGDSEWVWVPLPSAVGNTSSKGQSIRLLRIIETLKAHFGQVYMAWLKDVLLNEEIED
ncbi:hypothetical protein IMSHALPRED_006921 [Imshaugia aleurites]|uniref:PD-(D/E)XK nuclease-like domain-containing protein n=1 Tax=Imshaugia aleurites TaxID=172621 RepID=A0A8H3FS18_9LECA|nr:hypothetical protein IMSHALPRED_006921 [Imshaugia aleurites]